MCFCHVTTDIPSLVAAVVPSLLLYLDAYSHTFLASAYVFLCVVALPLF